MTSSYQCKDTLAVVVIAIVAWQNKNKRMRTVIGMTAGNKSKAKITKLQYSLPGEKKKKVDAHERSTSLHLSLVITEKGIIKLITHTCIDS